MGSFIFYQGLKRIIKVDRKKIHTGQIWAERVDEQRTPPAPPLLSCTSSTLELSSHFLFKNIIWGSVKQKWKSMTNY